MSGAGEKMVSGLAASVWVTRSRQGTWVAPRAASRDRASASTGTWTME